MAETQPTVNLDHVLAEPTGRPKSFTIGGEKFGLPAKFPFGAAILLDRGKVWEGLVALFGNETDAERFLTVTSSNFEGAIAAVASDVYGLDLGESSASSPSSKPTGKPSRPTSKRSTGSTSRKR